MCYTWMKSKRTADIYSVSLSFLCTLHRRQLQACLHGKEKVCTDTSWRVQQLANRFSFSTAQWLQSERHGRQEHDNSLPAWLLFRAKGLLPIIQWGFSCTDRPKKADRLRTFTWHTSGVCTRNSQIYMFVLFAAAFSIRALCKEPELTRIKCQYLRSI